MLFKDLLKDIISVTSALEFDTIVISNEDRGEGLKTYIESFTGDKRVILKAVSSSPVADIDGKFGIGNLGMLQGMLNFTQFKSDESNINIVKNERNEIMRLDLISDEAVSEFCVVRGRGIPMQPKGGSDLEFIANCQPTIQKTNELKNFTAIFKSVSEFVTPIAEQQKLTFFVGDINKNNHKGNIYFADTDSDLVAGYSYPVHRIQQALATLNKNNISMGFNPRGLLKVTVRTELAVYDIMINGSTL